MPTTVKIEKAEGLATLRLGREHGNAINEALVDDLLTAFQSVEADDEVRGAMLAASGKLFSPGLDLQELSRLERPAMERFMSRFSACLLRMYTFPKPLVAAVHGHAVAGGCILALTADWRILGEDALIGLNEVQVGVPFPFGVAMMLREAVITPRREEVALFGRNYRGQDAVDTGLANELHAAGGFEEFCRERLEELASKDAHAFAITKRYLRAATVERVRAFDAQFLPEFLDGWFSESTRARVAEVVARLAKR